VIIRRGKKVARRLLDLAAPSWHRIVDARSLKERPRQAGDLRWRPARRSKEPRLDAGGAVIGKRLYVIGGYASPEEVLNVVDILDMGSGRWTERWPTPPLMAQSHLAVGSDGERFIYVVSGQLGNHCNPATASRGALRGHGAGVERAAPCRWRVAGRSPYAGARALEPCSPRRPADRR
jgi:hypothetical protein